MTTHAVFHIRLRYLDNRLSSFPIRLPYPED